MKIRILTALLLAPLVVAAVYFGGLAWSFLIALISAFSAWEALFIFGKALRITSMRRSTTYFVGALTIISVLIMVFASDGSAFPASAAVLGLLVIITFIRSLPSEMHLWVCASVSSAIYAGIISRFFHEIFKMPEGAVIIMLIAVSIWTSDSAAYFFGIKYGKHKMCPQLSPKKSWEGAVAGVIGACLAALVGGHLLSLPMTLCLITGLSAGILGPLGDLFESAIKRAAGVKDSSGIFPGHGGMLDRIDSFTFVLPAVWLTLYISPVTGV